MRVWQTLLFAVVPAVVVYSAHWFVAPALSARLHQPYLVTYLICWGTTEVGFFAAALIAYRAEGNPARWSAFVERYRLRRPGGGDLLWALGTLAAMGLSAAALGFSARWLGSLPAFAPHPVFPRELTPEALSGLVPGAFMGMGLKGAWWVLGVYALGWAFNILGEELWYRGFLLPRQEQSHARLAWLVNGLCFWVLHVVWKWNLIALLPGSLVLSYVAQRRRTTWVGLLAHGVLNVTPLVAIAAGVLGAGELARPSPGWLKGQTHAHTNNSGDSQTPPLDAAKWYARHGFDFVVFTDHNRVTQLPPVDGMLVIPGMEITQNLKTCAPPPPPGMACLLHVNALFIDPSKLAQLEETQSDEREALYGRAIDAAKKMGALAQVNHPNFMYGADEPLLEKLAARGAHWLEVANTQSDANNGGDASHPSTEQLWDAALTHGVKLFGMATDDAHHYDDAEAVRARGEPVFTGDHGFIMVHARKSPAELEAAVERGDFYSSNGPKLVALEVSDGGIRLETASEAELRFIGPGGEVVHSERGTRAWFERGDRAYLRAEARFDDGGTVWTQPLFAR